MRSSGTYGLLVDYGGVLTSPDIDAFARFERELGVTPGAVLDLILEPYLDPVRDHPVAKMERGELTYDEFTKAFAELLDRRGHGRFDLSDLADRLFVGRTRVDIMWSAVENASEAGIRTALVSNSWWTSGYPVDELQTSFDCVIISGDVGMRKPERRMFRYVAGQLGVRIDRCAVVDDLLPNIEAARELGMFAVHHVEPEVTVRQLGEFFDVELSPSGGLGEVEYRS